MTTHDEKTQQHIDAICDVFKKEPERVKCGELPGIPSLCQLHEHPFLYSIKPKTLALGHNPDNLTVEQVGEGWRLLPLTTIQTRIGKPSNQWIEVWQPIVEKWEAGFRGSLEAATYRTRLSDEQLALLDKNEGWIPWFGDGEIPSGRVDVVSSMGKQIDGQDSEFWTNVWPHKDHIASIIAYRPAKQPTVVPWDCVEDVPGPACWIRSTSTEMSKGMMIVSFHNDGSGFSAGGHGSIYKWRDVSEREMEYSTDRINWFPCNKKSGVKGEK